MNGIHEVRGSIPLGSTTYIFNPRIDYYAPESFEQFDEKPNNESD